jgi:hypothetical protein
MRLLLLVITSLFLSGCAQNFHNRLSSDEELADECLKKAATRLKAEKDLYLCGTGGRMMDEIKMLALSFNFYKEVNVEEGRELLIEAVKALVDVVNADERIRPYLNNYPFSANNIQIRIFLQKRDFSAFGPDKLSVISSLQGILEYEIDDPETKLFKTVHKETYEEALLQLSSQAFKESV